MSIDDLFSTLKARGNWGHSGRPGKRGGSAPGGGSGGFTVPDKMTETSKYEFTIPVKNKAQLKKVLDKHIVDGQKGQVDGEYYKEGQGWTSATRKLNISQSSSESKEQRIKRLMEGYETARQAGATAYQAKFGTGKAFDTRSVTLDFSGNFDK